MRKRLWPSSLRTTGRIFRHARRFWKREAAQGRFPPVMQKEQAANALAILHDLHKRKNYGLERRHALP